MIIDVGKDFYHRLTNRNQHQGDGKNTAEDFRKKYLSKLDNQEFWRNPNAIITLDFSNVKKIGPSFANEAFAYFLQYTTLSKFKSVVLFKNISRVQKMIIDQELGLEQK